VELILLCKGVIFMKVEKRKFEFTDSEVDLLRTGLQTSMRERDCYKFGAIAGLYTQLTNIEN
jgi:hypothetical protein